MELSVKNDLERIARNLRETARARIPEAAAKAITQCAYLAQQAEVKEMRDVFDKPTPYTLSSTWVKPASKTTLAAMVKLKDEAGKGTPAAKYLLPQIVGGERSLKKFESALRSAGALPEGYFAVPGSGAQMDAFGNMSRGQIVQILSYFKAFPEAGYRANITDARRARLTRGTRSKQGFVYFVGRPGDGKLPLGIWQRVMFAQGSALKPIMLFVSAVHYGSIFDFRYVVRTVVEREFDQQFKYQIARLGGIQAGR